MEFASIIQFVSTTAMILGITFGILNLRNFQKMRRREAAILMLNSFQTNEFVRGLLLVLNMRAGITKTEIDELPKEDYLALYILLGAWERLGILVFHNEIAIELVDDAFSGPILITWQKMEVFIKQFRAEVQRDTGFEWLQWLAERMLERETKTSAIPAYIAHNKWKAK